MRSREGRARVSVSVGSLTGSGRSVALALQVCCCLQEASLLGRRMGSLVPPGCPREKLIGPYSAWTLGLRIQRHRLTGCHVTIE